MPESRVSRQHRFAAQITLSLILLSIAPVGQSVTFSNLLSAADFPAGAVSFADELVDFSPGIVFDPNNAANVPLPAYLGAENVLGTPDVDVQSVIDCSADPNTSNCDFASLGVGGSLTVRFTDNLLRGSGDASPDLWIFEAGPPEPTFVEVSTDGVTWQSVGLWATFALGVDLDAFGFGVSDTFAYVRLRDEAATGNTTGLTVGADIDAIGAISTTVVPLPAAVLLFFSALVAIVAARKSSA